MTTLDDMRARSEKAVKSMQGTQQRYDLHFPLRASARDVPDLLNLINSLTPLVQVALDFVHGEYDKDTLERLIDAADKLPWDTMRALGLLQEED